MRRLPEAGVPATELRSADVQSARASVEWLLGILPGIERAALEADVVEVERLLGLCARELSDLRGILSLRRA